MSSVTKGSSCAMFCQSVPMSHRGGVVAAAMRTVVMMGVLVMIGWLGEGRFMVVC